MVKRGHLAIIIKFLNCGLMSYTKHIYVTQEVFIFDQTQRCMVLQSVYFETVFVVLSGQSSVLRLWCCGPEIFGPQHDQIVWSCSGPGRALVLLHRIHTSIFTDPWVDSGTFQGFRQRAKRNGARYFPLVLPPSGLSDFVQIVVPPVV